jgi:hypothetical protein
MAAATLAISAAPASAAQQPPEAQLIALENAYSRALINRDRAFLMAYYAPDWRGGNWMGFWTKSTMLESVLTARYVVKSMTLRDLKVRVVGNIGIVQGIDDEVTSVGGRDTSGKWAFTDIFQRRGGRWVAIASHTSEVGARP